MEELLYKGLHASSAASRIVALQDTGTCSGALVLTRMVRIMLLK